MKNNVLLTVALAIILVLSFSTGYYYHKSTGLAAGKKAWRSRVHRKAGPGMRMHKKFVDPELHEQMETKRRELFESLRREPRDTAAVSERIEEINEIQRKIQKRVTAHILRKLDSLKDEDLDRYLNRLERHFGRGMGPGRDPARRHGRGPGRGPGPGPEPPPPPAP